MTIFNPEHKSIVDHSSTRNEITIITILLIVILNGADVSFPAAFRLLVVFVGLWWWWQYSWCCRRSMGTKVWRNERHLRRENIGRENRDKTIKEQESRRKSRIKVSTRRRGREGYNSCSLPFVTWKEKWVFFFSSFLPSCDKSSTRESF